MTNPSRGTRRGHGRCSRPRTPQCRSGTPFEVFVPAPYLVIGAVDRSSLGSLLDFRLGVTVVGPANDQCRLRLGLIEAANRLDLVLRAAEQ